MKAMPIRPAQGDLSGRWRVIHRVERSACRAYVGLEIEFDVVLEQDGERLTGRGEKFLVAGRLVRQDEVSRLFLTGGATGRQIHLEVVEICGEPSDRRIVGAIDWDVVTDDLMAGAFQVSAAESAGSSLALRR